MDSWRIIRSNHATSLDGNVCVTVSLAHTLGPLLQVPLSWLLPLPPRLLLPRSARRIPYKDRMIPNHVRCLTTFRPEFLFSFQSKYCRLSRIVPENNMFDRFTQLCLVSFHTYRYFSMETNGCVFGFGYIVPNMCVCVCISMNSKPHIGSSWLLFISIISPRPSNGSSVGSNLQLRFSNEVWLTKPRSVYSRRFWPEADFGDIWQILPLSSIFIMLDNYSSHLLKNNYFVVEMADTVTDI